MGNNVRSQLLGIIFVLSLIAGYVIVDPLTNEFSFYLFGGFSVGFLIFVGVFFYQEDS